MRMEIKLNFDTDHFKEFFFRDNQGHYFLSPALRRQFYALLIMGSLALLAITVFADNIFLVGILSIGFVVSLGYYLYAAFILWKWKMQIKEFLNKGKAYTSHTLILTDNAFSFIQDDDEHIEKWTSVKSVDITPEHLLISGDVDYIILMKSIGSEAFEEVKRIVSEKTA